MNTGKAKRRNKEESSEEELDYEDNVDLHAEAELVGEYMDSSESENELEEGEYESEEEENKDLLMKKCIENGDIEKLKQILKEKEDKKKRLQREVLKEQNKEKRRKEMQSILLKIAEVDKANSNLQRSLTSSRENTPSHSPGKASARKPNTTDRKKTKRDQCIVRQREESKEREQEKRSEYNDILFSFLKLKHGENQHFSELAVKAMEATDNILDLESRQKKTETELTGNKVKSGEELVKQVKSFKSKSGKPLAHERLVELLSLLENEKDTMGSESELVDSIHTLRLREPTVNTETKGNNGYKNLAQSSLPQEQQDNTHGSENKGEENNGTIQKLKSGKCAIPDKVDIKKVVKFPHERLDSRHVQTKVFDKLPFNLLIAGEMETISAPNITEQEAKARVEIAKTMCYHKNYLDDGEIRNGYDDIMKQVEQGAESWGPRLASKLHDYYVFRANVNLRTKMEEENYTKVERKQSKTERKEETENKGETERIVYCQDYNKKTCIHTDHHKGRFMGKKTTKWHLCSKCLNVGEKRSHPSIECARQKSS